MKEKIPFNKQIRDKKEKGNHERKEGERYEQEAPMEFNRFEKIPGDIKNSLLQLISAEYYKLPENKKNEGVPFTENFFDDLRRRLSEKKNNINTSTLENSPTILATVMKDPSIKGIIDPDAIKAKDASENPERDAMIKAYQKKLTEIIKEQMEKNKPFLHMLISERRKGAKDTIVLAGGMRNGKLPADPQVLRWFAEKLEEKIDKEGIGVDEKPVKVKVNIEGQPVCGSTIHTKRRDMLGDMYEFIKGKVPKQLLSGGNGNRVIDAFTEMAREFQEQFSDKESFERFIEDNTTIEDKNRLEGKLYYRKGLQESEEINEGEIAMGASLRRAFSGGLKVGDMVYIYNASNKKINDEGLETKVPLKVVPAKTKNRSENQKIGYRQPAINQNTLNNFGTRNTEIVIEKKL